MSAPTSKYESPVVIIGAGISGICTAIDMIRRNSSRSFIILERSAEPGGTWADNLYPGCRCDVPSHVYSFSFEPNPYWPDRYSAQPDILKYVTGVAEKWRLFPHFRFNTEVEECRWDEAENRWKVQVQDLKTGENYEIKTEFLVSCVGQLNMPHYPEIEGLDSFAGKVMHTARWDNTYSMEKKRIAVIGNGASAVQAVPELADICETMTVYQRTPNWVVPRDNMAYPSAIKTMLAWVPGLRGLYRSWIMDELELGYEAIVRPDTAFNKFLKSKGVDMMKEQLKNKPELIKELTPDYMPGCKRVIPHDDWYRSLDRPHIDLQTTPISHISSSGIITADGKEDDYDVLVLATGFRTVEFMHPIKVYGINGRPINDIWKGGAKAYLGMTVESLPNFAMAYGPNTNLGHNSIIMMVETQSKYINTLIGAVLNKKLVILPKPKTVAQYNTLVQQRMKTTTFGSNQCRSWYKNADGVVTNNWFGTVVEFQNMAKKLNWDDFEVSGDNAKTLTGKKVWLGRTVEESILSQLGFFKPIYILTVIGGMITNKVLSIFGF